MTEQERDGDQVLTEAFVALLGHDVRNALNGISTTADLLAMRAKSEEVARPANRILTSSDRVGLMVDQLLDFMRIRFGEGLPIQRENVDLSELCRVVMDELPAAEGCSVQLESVGDVVGFWDRYRLSQLLSTLAGNACQHRKADTAVLVRADGTQTNVVMLEVRNEGVIPESFLPILFDPLQARAGKKREGSSGLGLGLHVGRHIVVAHGGSIRVESSEQNGTRFVVELPRRAT